MKISLYFNSSDGEANLLGRNFNEGVCPLNEYTSVAKPTKKMNKRNVYISAQQLTYWILVMMMVALYIPYASADSHESDNGDETFLSEVWNDLPTPAGFTARSITGICTALSVRIAMQIVGPRNAAERRP